MAEKLFSIGPRIRTPTIFEKEESKRRLRKPLATTDLNFHSREIRSCKQMFSNQLSREGYQVAVAVQDEIQYITECGFDS